MSETLFHTEFCHLRAEIHGEIVLLHLDVWEWSHSKYRRLLALWKGVIHKLAANGIVTVFSVIPDNDKKLYKFQTKFGMREVAHQEGVFLFCKETT